MSKVLHTGLISVLLAALPAGAFADAAMDRLDDQAESASTLDFTDGVAVVTQQGAGTWEYFRVDVPEPGTGDEALLGWQVRLEGSTSAGLSLAVRRDDLPSAAQPNLYSLESGAPATWPSGYGFTAPSDELQRPVSADGTRTNEHLGGFTLAYGQPLQPGVYYLGVWVKSGFPPTSYRLVSRAVGPGAPVPVQFLVEPGTQGTVSLPARDQAAFVVEIPPQQRSWLVRAEFEPGGDGIVYLRRQFLPDTFNPKGSVTSPDRVSTQLSSRHGSERLLLLPVAGETYLPAGRYIFLVHSRGANSTASQRVGPDPAVVHFHQDGPLPIEDLGQLEVGESAERAISYPAGVFRAFRFRLPTGVPFIELALSDRVGNPAVAIVRGASLVRPRTQGGGTYGVFGGVFGTDHPSVLTLTEPEADEYLVVVADASRHYGNGGTPAVDGSATLHLAAMAPTPLAFNGGEVEVIDQPPESWRYFAVTVMDRVGPAEVLGWEVQRRSLTTPNGIAAIRRGLLPVEIETPVTGGNPWRVGRVENLGSDFARRANTPGSALKLFGYHRSAMGYPLTPDTYYIGIKNWGSSPVSYYLSSAAVGEGLARPITVVGFAGGEATVTGLAPRDSHTFAVDIPEGALSWEVEVTGGASDVDLFVRRDFVPEPGADTFDNLAQLPFNSVRSVREGGERFVLAPYDDQTTLPAGRYYATVVNIGEQAASSTAVGTGEASVTFRSRGELAVTDLGVLSLIPIEQTGGYEAGQQRAYQIEIPPGVLAMTVRLADRVGNPGLAIAPGTRLPTMPARSGHFASTQNRYGMRGGVTAAAESSSVLTLSRPAPGRYTMLVADVSPHYVSFPSLPAVAGSYTLQVSQVLAQPLNLSVSQNAAGGSHTATGTLAVGERHFYEVVVPEGLELDGEALLGWKLTLPVSPSGIQVRLHYDPTRFEHGVGMNSGTHLITPPYLRPGLWQIEVSATSSTTSYTLTSSLIELHRPAWALPLTAADPVAPGVDAGYFGDSGVDVSGQPLPGDQGIDLANTDFHVYAVDVPPGNAGLLRTTLIALTGDPNLFIRRDHVPTRSHRPEFSSPFSSWSGGGSFERSLTGTGTESGNWVPIDTRVNRLLLPGRYYLAVQANGTNVRYRLRLAGAELIAPATLGDQPLAKALVLNGPPLTDQTLATREWRYYQFVWPENAPQSLQLTFSATSGSVTAYLRADAPPGAGATPTDYRDWGRDQRNSPPPGVTLASWSAPRTVSLDTTPLRPGSVYWLGFRASTAASFSVGATTSGLTILERFGAIESLAFYGGVLNATLEAGETRFYRVNTPLEGERLRIIGEWSGPLDVRLEQGMLPLPGVSSHRQLNPGLFSARLDSHPWQPDSTYYLRATNATGAPIHLTLTIDGRNAETDDEDMDGMPDAWERRYLGVEYAFPWADLDSDGVGNLDEYLRGTDPTDPDSVIYELRLVGVGAEVAAEVEGSLFARGTVVIATATPEPGLAFVGWGFNDGAGTTDGTTFTAVLDRDIRLTAYAGLPIAQALDAPELTFTTGGVALGVGQTDHSQDGTDAVRIAGPLDRLERGWVETTVVGPGLLTFQWRLERDVDLPTLFNCTFNGTQQAQLVATSDWAPVTRTVNDGPVTVRWTLQNGSGVPAESTGIGYLDEVSFLPFEAPTWLPAERINDQTVRLSWEPVASATAYSIQVFADSEATHLVASESLDLILSHDLTDLPAGVTRFVRVVAMYASNEGPPSPAISVTGFGTPAPQVAWAQHYGLAEFNPLADLNGDGRSLLYAYALDLDPRTGGGSGVASGVSESGGQPVLTLTFVRRTDDPRLRYFLREGHRLTSTTAYPLADRLVGSPDNLGPGRERVTVRSSLPLTPGTTSGFVWLEITLDP